MGIVTSFLNLFSGQRSVALASEDGFVDLDIPISGMQSTDSGVLKVTAKGKLKGQPVALVVELDPLWQSKPIPDSGASFYWGKARLRSLGSESDSFVRLISEMYGHPCSDGKMPPSIEAEAVGLANDPSNARTQPTKMKFFFNSNSESDYSEIFINIDAPKRVLQFHEKDPEYREPLARTLCGVRT